MPLLILLAAARTITPDAYKVDPWPPRACCTCTTQFGRCSLDSMTGAHQAPAPLQRTIPRHQCKQHRVCCGHQTAYRQLEMTSQPVLKTGAETAMRQSTGHAKVGNHGLHKPDELDTCNMQTVYAAPACQHCLKHHETCKAVAGGSLLRQCHHANQACKCESQPTLCYLKQRAASPRRQLERPACNLGNSQNIQ